jgi:hypothetical protein
MDQVRISMLQMPCFSWFRHYNVHASSRTARLEAKAVQRSYKPAQVHSHKTKVDISTYCVYKALQHSSAARQRSLSPGEHASQWRELAKDSVGA